MGKAARYGAGMNSAREMAAARGDVTTAESAVAGKAPDMTPAEAPGKSTEAAAVTGVLRPQRYGQGESERRDGNQATHTTT